MSYGWNEETDEQLRQLWGTGMASMKIARAMGRTKGSVIGRAHRLGLEKREQPGSIVKAKNVPPVGNPKGALEVTRAQERAQEALTALAAVAPPPEPEPAPAPILGPLRPLPFWLGATPAVRECQWPIGHPRRPGFRFCCAPPVPDRPYCRAHCEIAYIGFGRPRQEPLRVWIRGQRV
jgi:GcrA cell cycle regulator